MLFDAFGRWIGRGPAEGLRPGARVKAEEIVEAAQRQPRRDHIERSDGDDTAYDFHPRSLRVPHVTFRMQGGGMRITWNERACCRCRNWRYRDGQEKIAREGFPFLDDPKHWGEFSPKPWDMGLCQEHDAGTLTHKFAHCEAFRAADDSPRLPPSEGAPDGDEALERSWTERLRERATRFFRRGETL